MAKTGKERKEIVQENVKSGTVRKIETYQQLRITINDEGNLKEHIEMITERSNKQQKSKSTFYKKVQKIAKNLLIDISDVTSTNKSKWNKKVKRKAIERIRKSMKEDVQEKVKC